MCVYFVCRLKCLKICVGGKEGNVGEKCNKTRPANFGDGGAGGGCSRQKRHARLISLCAGFCSFRGSCNQAIFSSLNGFLVSGKFMANNDVQGVCSPSLVHGDYCCSVIIQYFLTVSIIFFDAVFFRSIVKK